MKRLRPIHRFASLLGISWYRRTRVGIKTINASFNSNEFDAFAVGEQFEVEPGNLYLSVDYLVDSETLLGQPLRGSPHVELMQVIDGGIPEEICETHYMRRARSGTLDPRPPISPTATELILAHDRCRRSITDDSYSPIRIVRNQSKMFIADGKHRAAMCATVRCSVRAVDVTPAYSNSHYVRHFDKMRNDPDSFRVHIRFFSDFFAALETKR